MQVSNLYNADGSIHVMGDKKSAGDTIISKWR